MFPSGIWSYCSGNKDPLTVYDRNAQIVHKYRRHMVDMKTVPDWVLINVRGQVARDLCIPVLGLFIDENDLYSVVWTSVQRRLNICAESSEHLCSSVWTSVQRRLNICAASSEHLCSVVWISVQRRLNIYIPKAGGSLQRGNTNLATNEAEILYQLCLVGAWTSGRLNLRSLWSMAGDEMGFVGIVLSPVSADVQSCVA